MAAQPPDTVSKETLAQMATVLAGTSFSEADLEQLAPQIATLLADLQQLEALDLSQVDPALRFVCAEGAEDGC